ncbi:MAG: hypothetical protein ABS75_24450 [Pelagibacterium sp. SCN 63-23]|nr:MAG: hypothetical protein ABS75_24450 [Pelagibacterium sp. SCN 63-23]
MSKASSDRDATIDLFRFLSSVKARPVELGELPIIPNWKEVLQNALPRPSVPARLGDSQASWSLWSALQNTFMAEGSGRWRCGPCCWAMFGETRLSSLSAAISGFWMPA